VQPLIQSAQSILDVRALAGMAQARHSKQLALTRSFTAGRSDIDCLGVIRGDVKHCGRQANERLAITLTASARQHCGTWTGGGSA